MEKEQLNRYLSLYTSDATCKEFVFQLAEKGAIDSKVIRNELINRDFILHYQKGTPIMDIYAYISVTYGISERMAMDVVKAAKAPTT